MVFGNHKKESTCRWRRRKEARPEEILEAALSLFTEKGFAATRMNDIAKLAGISKGTLYLYFDSKEAIFKAVVQQLVEPQIDRNESMVDEYEGTAVELLRQMVMGMWESIGNSSLSAIPKLMVSESGNFPELAHYFVNHVVKRSRKLFIKVIQRGVERGELKACEPAIVARLITAPLVHAAIWMHSLAAFDDAQDTRGYIEQHIDLFLHGLATDAGSRT
jgi:AcrR family transcriptional regulator